MAGDGRYSRQNKLIGDYGQAALSNARVLCVGAGGLGCLVSSFLVAAGVGYIGIVDGDAIEISNLTRQITYHEEDCGKYKVDALYSHLTKLNSNSQIIVINDYITSENILPIIKSYDLILDCSDNFATRYLLNDWCQVCDRPLISAGIDGFMGQVMVLIGDVCYRCIFPDPPIATTNCQNGIVVGPAVGIVASIQANEAFKYLTQINEESCLIQVDSLSNQVKQYQISANKACCNYERHQILDEVTVNYLAWQEVLRQHKDEELSLIDIRNPLVRMTQPLVGTLGLTDIDNVIDNMDLDNFSQLSSRFHINQKLVIVCSFGVKSKLLAKRFKQNGFQEIYYTKF